MPHVVVRFRTSMSAPAALGYLGDFSHAPEWDPSVSRAVRLDEGPLREGSSFDLIVSMGRRSLPLRYEVTECDDDHVVLRARSARLESLDRISVVSMAEGAELTYDARLRLLGPWRVLSPLLGIAFRRLAARAAEGIRQRVA